MTNRIKKIAIIYHGDCWDGFGGGYAAWKKFGARADYFGLEHGDSLPAALKGKVVYIIDFGFEESVMRKILRTAARVIVLDHHVSAEKSTKMASEHVYRLDRSGAVIAWNYFFPDKKTPELLRHIEDVDLWKFRLPRTKELMAYMGTVDCDFKVWDKLARDWENSQGRKPYVEKGKCVLRYENKIVEQLVEGAELAEFEGRKTLVVNSPILRSQIGNALVKKLPPISIIWREKNGKILVALRSNGKADVSKIAEKYGGGGHKAAAGFSLPVGKPFPWKLL